MLRKNKNISQEQLADMLNTSRQAVSKWERGEAYPDIDKLKDLAIFFNVSIDYLLDYDIESVSVNKFIARMEKAVEDLNSDISVEEVKTIISKNRNNFDLLFSAIYYLQLLYYLDNDEQIAQLIISYCERAIVIYQDNNRYDVKIKDIQNSIIEIYMAQEKYDLAKKYIEENKVDNAEISLAFCECELGNYESSNNISSNIFLKSVASIVNVNINQVRLLLRTNRLKEAYDLDKWCIDFIKLVEKNEDMLLNISFVFYFIKASCERYFGIDNSNAINYLKENIDRVEKISKVNESIKFYGDKKTNMYIIVGNIKKMFFKEINKALKNSDIYEDALDIYKEIFGDFDYE